MNCVGGTAALNAGRYAVLFTRTPISGLSIVIERCIEDLLRREGRDDLDPCILPDDALACSDSAVTNIAEVVKILGVVGVAGVFLGLRPRPPRLVPPSLGVGRHSCRPTPSFSGTRALPKIPFYATLRPLPACETAPHTRLLFPPTAAQKLKKSVAESTTRQERHVKAMHRNEKRFSRRRLLTGIAALALAAGASLAGQPATAQEGEPIVIGNILDQSGGLNIYSLKQIKGVELAVKEINESGGLLGRPVEIRFYDSQSDNALNSQYTTNALLRDKVAVIHGGITSSSREVMRPIVRRFGGLLFYNSLYEGGVCDRRHVSTGMVPAQQLEALIPYVIEERGAKKSYILAADYNYGHITAKWMKKLIEENGGEVVATEFFPLDVTNFAPVLARIQEADPDVVYSALVGGAHMGFYRQFESTIGKDEMLLASSTYGVGREQTELSPEEGEGIVIATSFVDDLDTPAAKEFVEKFKAYSGEDDYVGEYGEYGYRGVMLWADAVRKAGSADPDKVIEELASGEVSFDGPGGLYTIDGKTNHTTMDIHIAVGNDKGSFDVIESFPQQPPLDTQLVCDLHANPDDTTQYEPEVE